MIQLNDDSEQDACQWPQAKQLLIRSDTEELILSSQIRPDWANAAGRDPFGLWASFEIPTSEGRVSQRLRWIPPGRFIMGSPSDEAGRFDNEGPQHEVMISQGYWLFDTPCTQALWQTIMDANSSEFKSPKRPVESISWEDVQEFIARLNQQISGLNLVLPSEAQWEYACRAGTNEATFAGDLEILGDCNAPILDRIAWYAGNSGVDFDLQEGVDSSDWPEKQYPHSKAGTREVAGKDSNPWGLYDMLGNVWEWCQDGQRDYVDKAVTDPRGSFESGAGRVVRGGSWNDDAGGLRSAYRVALQPDYRNDDLGFRCARVHDPEE